MDTLKNVVGEAREKLEEFEELAKATASDALNDFKRVVKRHPVESVLVSLGVGVLLGAFLRRRH